MYVVCLRDVTERRESEQAMRESEARYRLLVDHAPEAIVVFDADAGCFVDVNENAEPAVRSRSRAAAARRPGGAQSAAAAGWRRLARCTFVCASSARSMRAR